MNEDSQVLRLICCAVAYFGIVAKEGYSSAGIGARIAQCRRALELGGYMFKEVQNAGYWPIVKDARDDSPSTPT